MTQDSRDQLSLVEAKLFASTDFAVIHVVDASSDPAEAVQQLQAMGMNESEANTVLEMPLRARTHSERTALLHQAERLRSEVDQ